MIGVILFAFALTIVTWICMKWQRVKNFWNVRNVPHFPPHPLMGSLTFLQKKNPGIYMREAYDHFRSPYVGMWLFWRPTLIINSPEIIKRILVKDFDVFRDRFLGSGRNDPIGSLNMFTVNDPLWTLVRKRLTSVFTASKLRVLHGIMHNKSLELVQRLKQEVKSGERINMRVIYSDYTTDVIGTSSFGVKQDATLTGDSPMRRVTKDFMEYSIYRGLGWSCIFFLPELVEYLRFTFFPKSATDYFTKMYRRIVAERESQNREEYKDLLDALIKMKKEAKADDEEINEEILVAQAAVFLQAGFETSGTNLTFATLCLAHHPEIQERVYEEISEAKKRVGDRELTDNDYSELIYFNCIIKEVLRLFPPMGWLDRIASKDYRIDDHVTISAGTPVYVNAIGIHYDPHYFPEPEKFNPDRFLPENEKDIKPFTYMPFGEGPRNCIGKRFATQQVHYALAQMILSFKFRPFPDTPRPEHCPIEKRGMFFTPGCTLYVDFIPRC